MLKFTELAANTVAALFPQAEHTALHSFPDAQPIITIQDGDTSLGYALLQEDGRAWLHYIYIAEDYRRQYLGKTLMSVAASKAVEWQQWLLFAEAPSDETAMAFCRAIGFTPCAGDPALLALDLTDPSGMRHGR